VVSFGPVPWQLPADQGQDVGTQVGDVDPRSVRGNSGCPWNWPTRCTLSGSLPASVRNGQPTGPGPSWGVEDHGTNRGGVVEGDIRLHGRRSAGLAYQQQQSPAETASSCSSVMFGSGGRARCTVGMSLSRTTKNWNGGWKWSLICVVKTLSASLSTSNSSKEIAA